MPELNSYLALLIYSGLIYFIAWRFTGIVYRFAVSKKILDHPNDRSLHTNPTPRGGGISISILVLLTTVAVWLLGYLSNSVLTGILGGACLVAITGWIDDRYGIAAATRGFVYLCASIWVVYWIYDSSVAGGGGRAGIILISILGVTWLTNLYNFMDGSDGIAATQAICTGFLMTILFFMLNQTGNAFITASLTASALGFLMWNWPPAKIFMGDVGSCLIGFMFAALAISSILQSEIMLTIWLITLSVFICDSTLTLIKRIVAGEKWYRAHRQHAYQRLIQMGFSHKEVNYFLIIVNLCLLFPVVFFVWSFPEYKWWATITVYALLSGIWLYVQIKYIRYETRAEIE